MKKEAWFKSWFDTDYYHKLYKNRDEKEANTFIDNLITKLELNQNAEILDLGCGKGRHAFKMSHHFKSATGIDLSKNSIQIAKKLVKRNLNFQTGDMRNFNLNTKYDYIFNLFTSFGYFENFEENSLVLNNCNNHLNTNGLLFIDYLNPKKVVKTLIEKENKIIDNTSFTILKRIEGDFVIKNIQINDNNKKVEFFEKVQLIDLEMFSEILKKSSFSLVQTFGNYNLDDYDENSDRLIIVAKKN
jgi:cyclopropane fatty-acyl-phospholipid synthase-like methyltransferase